MTDTTEHPSDFSSLGLSTPILNAVLDAGYKIPSPIQQKAIPAILKNIDVMAAAQTGTGKTAGFTLPILDLLAKGPSARSNQARALILTPTRELAAQVHESIITYSKYLHMKSAVVFGGVKINPQMLKLLKGVDILVATPGRLLDLYRQNAIKFNQLEILVLDEADRMLDMGFIHDIKKIIALLPKKRQNLMFSATFSDEIRNLAKQLVHNPIEISVSPANAAANTVTQIVHPVDKEKKTELLAHLINNQQWKQALVFTRTKHGANKLVKKLVQNGIDSAAIHGNKSQSARTTALLNFKNGTTRILIATDIASRGIDIDMLPHVVNFDLPEVPEDYVHRIGRTGRAGLNGQAISLVCADESKELFSIEKLIKTQITREIIEGFEPSQQLTSKNPHQFKPDPNKTTSRKKPKRRKPSNIRAQQ